MSQIETSSGVVQVVRGSGHVEITDGTRETILLRPRHACDIADLLDNALTTAVDGLVGAVPTLDGHHAYVVRWGLSAVSVHDHPLGWRNHAGWGFRIRDGVEALRDALREAAGADAQHEPSPPADDSDVAELLHAEPPEPTTRPRHTLSHAPNARRAA